MTRALQDGAGDLSRLHDVLTPAAVPDGLVAPGWGLVLPAVALAAIVLLVAAWRRHTALAWRREALAELSRLRADDRARELPALVKRVALAAYPRERVAALTGEAWWAFLDETGGGGRFAAGAGAALARLAYEPGDATERASSDDVPWDAARAWIRARGPRA